MASQFPGEVEAGGDEFFTPDGEVAGQGEVGGGGGGGRGDG